MLTALFDLFVAIWASYAGNLLSKIDSKHCSFKMKKLIFGTIYCGYY